MKLFIKTAVSAAFVTVCIMQCETPESERAEAVIKRQVFEAPRDVVDAIIPQDARKPIKNSTYMVVEGNQATASSLLESMVVNPGLLFDGFKHVTGWNMSTGCWVHAEADVELLGVSLGTGFFGVRTRNGAREIKIEYEVHHTIDCSRPDRETEPKTAGTLPIDEKFLYEGPIPPGNIIIFMKPFVRSDGTELVHLLVFEVVRWEDT